MTINRKMIRNIIISVVILALLICAYIFVPKWLGNGEGQTGEMQAAITVFSTQPDNVAEIAIKNSFSEYTLRRSDEGENTWFIPEPEYVDIKFSQEKLTLAATAFTMGVYANKEIGKDVKNLEEFGLTEEKNTATIRTKDGAECTLILGNKVSVDSSYYLMKKGENTVYVVPESTALSILKIPNDYRETNNGGVDVATLEELAVYKNDEKLVEFKKFSADDEISEIDMIDIKMTYPYEERIRSDVFETLIGPFSMAVEVVEFISDDLSKVSEYGLDKGYKVILKDAKKTHTLTFGNIAENGYVYAMYNDVGYIFTMDPSMLYAVQDIKPFDYVRKFAHIYNMENIKSVTISASGKTYTLAVKGAGENSEYSINGKKASEEAFSIAYQEIIGMMFSDVVNDRSKATDVLCEITFNMADGKTNKAVYHAYDDRNAMVTRPDGKEYLILKKQITNMISAVEKLEQNPNPAQ